MVNFDKHFWSNKKSNGSNDGNYDQGTTIFDAIRIIRNNDGLFIKLNDATFSRSDTNRNRVAKSSVTGHWIVLVFNSSTVKNNGLGNFFQLWIGRLIILVKNCSSPLHMPQIVNVKRLLQRRIWGEQELTFPRQARVFTNIWPRKVGGYDSWGISLNFERQFWILRVSPHWYDKENFHLETYYWLLDF